MTRFASLVLISLALGASPAAQTPAVSDVDRIFAAWSTGTPGCAVGVSRGGRVLLERAYGMADLERAVPNTAATIFEAGSVAKQFTAAAVLLLAQDGKLSLEDPARTYLPELPDYGAPLTIRQMLQHTSGLRDWGEVAAIGGWPRGTRVHTHAHVLDIVSRQRSLNFTPGTQYSYSNTGYNLAAVIVQRVSGTSLAEFTRARIFEPLGMTRTSWRDDHRRIVRDRAVAYGVGPSGFATNMPFENVYGNGGLLTTVGDLLIWNDNFVTGKVGGPAFLALQREPGRFNDGKPHPYAMGLRLGEHKGMAEVGHSGATAGYRAHLTYFPDRQLSVAVLCNVTSGNASQSARRVADLYLGGAAETPAEPDPPKPAPAVFTPAPADLAAYAGRYDSDEAEASFVFTAEHGALVLTRRPGVRVPLEAVARDVFALPGGERLTFHRRSSGGIESVGLAGSRVFDMRFARAVSSAGMTRVAKGTFDVTMAPLAFENASEGAPLSRMSLTKTFHGDLAASASGQMIAAFTAVKESAAYSAIELVTGTLGGRQGTFVLQHTGVMHRGAQELLITVVPDSATGALAGLSGRMMIRIEGGHHYYEFTYTLPD